jgi:mRNA-degrading endonuclease RelE of RelBE toxin-antitoxin system
MFQVVFNELSAAEMAEIPKTLQLDLLAEFQFLPEDLDKLETSGEGAGKFGVLERDGKKLYRYRTKDYRIYFQRTSEGISVHRVLHKNTLSDFLFRAKLPMVEDEQLSKKEAFWQLIDAGAKARKA